jgi:putative ABC transport system permease protein
VAAAWLWARTDIRRRWSLLVLLAAVVALAVSAVVALVAGAQRAGAAVERYLDATGTAEVVVFTGADLAPELLGSLADDPRIERIERSVTAPIAPSPAQPGENAFMFVGIDGPLAGVGRPPLLSGRYPEPGAPDEVVVNERLASAQDLRIGQQVLLRALPCFVYSDCPPEPIGEVTIVGVVRLPPDLVDDPTVEALTLAGSSLLGGRWRDYPRPAAVTWIHLYDRSDTAAVVSDVAVRVADGTVEDNVALLNVARRAARWQHDALVIAALVTGFAGLLVVAQALARHLGGRAQDVPTLAALGLTPRRRWAAAMLAISPAVAGGVAGAIGLAFGVSPVFPLGVARRAEFDVGLRSDGLIVGAVGAIAVVAVVAAIVARRWSARAVSDKPAAHPSIAARVTRGLALRPAPAAGARLALERRHGSARLPVVPTLIALVSTTAIAVGAVVVAWSLHGLVTEPQRFGQAWDVRVDFFGGGLRDGAIALAADPRVADVAISRLGELNLTGSDSDAVQVGAMGLEDLTGRSALTVLEGRAPSSTREIALASTTMKTLGLRLGETTMASGSCGAAELTVVGRVIVPLTDDIGDPDRGSVVTIATLDELCGQGLVSSLDENANALVRFRDDVTVSAVRDEWRTQGLSVDDREVPGTIASFSDIGQVPMMVAALTALLGAAAAAHALILGVRRRSHDFAVLRALGLRPHQAGGVVHWQAATLALIALVAGVPLGVLLGRLVWTAIAQPANVLVRTDVLVPALALLATAVMVLALTLSIWPAHRATRLRPASLLRSE